MLKKPAKIEITTISPLSLEIVRFDDIPHFNGSITKTNLSLLKRLWQGTFFYIKRDSSDVRKKKQAFPKSPFHFCIFIFLKKLSSGTLTKNYIWNRNFSTLASLYTFSFAYFVSVFILGCKFYLKDLSFFLQACAWIMWNCSSII